ncbi:MAG: type II secretion system F family protein, partial [Candidatus Limnocylindria bacterium]
RVRIQGEIQTLTAMQRYSGYVIVLLPVGLAALLFVISPTYMLPMIERPPELIGLPMGIVLFGLGLMSMGIGWLFIRRIVDIKV